ncbi:MAG: hypothetical protein JRJ00_17435 [Deltaproteobacteria bacterium]|nr:hypothetical protein [Deltaproteobacteria bacterium]
MDADCLIKLTKAGLKELVGAKDTIIIPKIVKKEVVDSGKLKGCADAYVVEKNIGKKMIAIIETSSNYTKGDQALIALFRKNKYDAVATDDKKLTRLLKTYSIPFILPSLIIYQLFTNDHIDKKTALRSLKQLANFISEDEFSTVRLLMEKTNES